MNAVLMKDKTGCVLAIMPFSSRQTIIMTTKSSKICLSSTGMLPGQGKG